MRCPFCHHSKTKVVDSREAGPEIRRRRACLSCQKRFTTFERVEPVQRLIVVKKDGSRVPFDRDRIKAGVEKACYKRPVSARQVEQLVAEVEEQLFLSGRDEISADRIGGFVADRLKNVDTVSYIRFASVYREFRDIDDLTQVIQDLKEDLERGGSGQRSLFDG